MENCFKDEKIYGDENSSIITTIHKVLAPFMLRRLKVDVLDNMVPKKEVFVYCPLTNLQKNLYRFTLEGSIDELKNRDKVIYSFIFQDIQIIKYLSS